ncbi:MAG: aminopeptidase P family protein [Bacillota bacterium]
MPFKNRCKQIQVEITKKNLNGLLVTDEKNRYYLSGFTGSAGYLLITEGDAYLLTDFRYIKQAQKEATCCRVMQHANKWTTTLLELTKLHNIRVLGFEQDQLSYTQFELLKKEMYGVELAGTKDVTESLRECKDEVEVKFIKKAATIADQAFQRILTFLKPGIREIELAAELEYQMRLLGGNGFAFETIIASGFRSALPHGVASEKKLEPGDLVVIDFGAIYQGYRSDMTRTIKLGKATAREKEIYQLVLEAQLASLEHIKAGETCDDIDKLARDIIRKKGYGEYFGHSLGHGVGLDIHENPRLAEGNPLPLKAGMVVTVEPGIYLEGWGGVRIEDMVLVTEKGYQNFTKTSKELLEINL